MKMKRYIKKMELAPALKSNPNRLAKPFAGHSGFLYLRCPSCGAERGFCARYPIFDATCKNCGKLIPLPDRLVSIFFRCECGKSYKYLTNITDPMFDLSCMECGTPNTVILNRKRGVYVDVKKSK